MRQTMRWILVAVVSLLWAAPLMGVEESVLKAEKPVEARKPTLTFYYFDG